MNRIDDLVRQVTENGGEANHIYMSAETAAKLSDDLESIRMYVSPQPPTHLRDGDEVQHMRLHIREDMGPRIYITG